MRRHTLALLLTTFPLLAAAPPGQRPEPHVGIEIALVVMLVLIAGGLTLGFKYGKN